MLDADTGNGSVIRDRDINSRRNFFINNPQFDADVYPIKGLCFSLCLCARLMLPVFKGTAVPPNMIPVLPLRSPRPLRLDSSSLKFLENLCQRFPAYMQLHLTEIPEGRDVGLVARSLKAFGGVV